MTYPAPLPDELASGHIGRLKSFGPWADRPALLRGLRAAHPTQGGRFRRDSNLEVVAAACGLDLATYAGCHSMLPFINLSADCTNRQSGFASWSQSLLTLRGLQAPRKLAYMCRSCVKEDLAFRGYSYWRRSLQVPGTSWCEKHAEPLLVVDQPDAFWRAPSEWVDDGRFELPSQVSSADRQHPLAIRFSETANALLDMGRPWPDGRIRKVLKERARNFGMSGAPKGLKPRLSDIAVAFYPRALIEELIPNIAVKKEGEYLASVDSLLGNQGVLATTKMIAMTLLYETTEQAIRACCQDAPATEFASD